MNLDGMKSLTVLTALVIMFSTTLAFANLGDGVMLSYKPDVVSTGDDVTLQIQLKNDATDPSNCIDEIIITPPDTWGGTASVDVYDRSAYTDTREETNDDISLSGDSQSSRIVPVHSLCPGETVNIEISGLVAPSDYEVSTIIIKTSDLTHNDVGSSKTYQTIDPSLPEITVTHATKIKVKYFRITGFTSSGFNGRAWGADARLATLALDASVAGNLKIEMETGTTDAVLYDGPVAAGAQWITLTYPTNSATYTDYNEGYLPDQAGARAYYITYAGSLTLLGSTDAILDDEDLIDSGLAGSKGTIITAGSSEQRKVLVQIVDGNNYDIGEVIPIHTTHDPGITILEMSPYTTDSNGEAFFTIEPKCVGAYGVNEFTVLTDPLKTTPSVTEYVGVNAGPAYSYAVTAGAGAYVPAAGSELIEVTVYDSCGNVVTNTDQVLVGFDYMGQCIGDHDKLADVPEGTQNDHHQENTDMGIADVYLVTDCELCTHDVQITVIGIGGETIQLYGINGPPAKMQVTIDETEITADQCVEALIEVVDECGNLVAEIPSEVGDEMEQWESIVRVTVDRLYSDQWGYATQITTTDLREEYIAGSWVQGKLNGGVGHVTICGCMGLGMFDVVAESDTIEPGMDTVNVINADPMCIEVDTEYDQLLLCEREMDIDIAIKDICGNYWINQECSSGGSEENYCVNIELDGTCVDEIEGAYLSTESACVPVGTGGPGYLETPVILYRDTDDCCQLDILVSQGTGCCGDFGPLPMCDPVSVLFHGAPVEMTTEFYKVRTNPFNQEEQLHGLLPVDEVNEIVTAYETVSEEVLDLFTVYDACGHIVKDYDGTIDVKKENDDCASIYQVDHPLELEGGWCTGHVECKDLTQFGEEKCLETPYHIDGRFLTYCEWYTDDYQGQCYGTPDCTLMLWENMCENWGCIWDGDSCAGDPDFECEDPNAPGASNKRQACVDELGCTWVPEYTCEYATGGPETSNMPNNCRAYTDYESETYPTNGKEQCIMVGDAVEQSCTWTDLCEFDDELLKKLVIHNCKDQYTKGEGYWPAWTPLEVEDIMVDKIALMVNHEIDPPNLWVEVYLESEWTPGFQPAEDRMVGKAPAMFGVPTIIELKDSATPYWDDQRQGGVLIRAEDSRDFYIFLVNYASRKIDCGVYDIDFLWYQDYTGPDFTNFGCGDPDSNNDGVIDEVSCGGSARDGYINSDNFNWMDGYLCFMGMCDSRNDDYMCSTYGYGFGDVYIDDLKFKEGQAWTKQRDLTAETVYDWVLDVQPSGAVCDYSDAEIVVTPQPEVVQFISQPATQIKLLNHDADAGCESKTVSCASEWDPEDNAYLLNIQTTDGFDNPHGKVIDVELEYCLKMPFGDWMIGDMVNKYCMMHMFDQEVPAICDHNWFVDSEHCFTRGELKELIMDSMINDYMGDALFGEFFGQEFTDWVDAYFDEAKVEFWDINEDPLPYDAYGHQVVTTDSYGQAQVYVTAQKAGLYKVIARPLALDGATTMVSFGPGSPAQLDLMALPSFGVPADGEQEALLLLRAFDSCGNLVHDTVSDVTVAVALGEQVYISQDFEGKNNYDGVVTGDLEAWGCFGFTKLAVLSDLPQTAIIEASASGLQSDGTSISFQGAPVKLAITEIAPSDRLPADGQTGGWVTIQVQDKNGNRVTGYLGNGFSGDPGDPWGITDYVFDNICISLDDIESFIPDWFMTLADIEMRTFGWTNLYQYGANVWCGNLMFGEGKVYVTYGNPDCNHGGTVNVDVTDIWPFNGQEFDENGIPFSIHTTQLTPAAGHLDFVDPASQWDIWADKPIVLADGQSYTLVTVQVENPYMDVRQAVEGVVYIGGSVELGAEVSWILCEGDPAPPEPLNPGPGCQIINDELNPTSVRFVTNPLTGKAYLLVKSTEPGIAEITVVGGDAYTCMGIDDITLGGCMEFCMKCHRSFSMCFEKCMSGDLGFYNCPTCEEYIPKFWCHYSWKEDLTPKTITVEFLEVADNELYLEEGWNFVSVPFALSGSPSVNDLLGSAMCGDGVTPVLQNFYAWDEFAQGWTFDLNTVMTPLSGYWIQAGCPYVLSLSYVDAGAVTPPSKEIVPGWNTVGLSWNSPIVVEYGLISIDDSYTSFIDWEEAIQEYGLPVANTGTDFVSPFTTYGVEMAPKEGYWIWVTDNDAIQGWSA